MRDIDKVRQAIRSLGGVEFTSKQIKKMFPDMPYIPQHLRDLCIRRKELARGMAKFSYVDIGVKAPRKQKMIEQIEVQEQKSIVAKQYRNDWSTLGRLL